MHLLDIRRLQNHHYRADFTKIISYFQCNNDNRTRGLEETFPYPSPAQLSAPDRQSFKLHKTPGVGLPVVPSNLSFGSPLLGCFLYFSLQ